MTVDTGGDGSTGRRVLRRPDGYAQRRLAPVDSPNRSTHVQISSVPTDSAHRSNQLAWPQVDRGQPVRSIRVGPPDFVSQPQPVRARRSKLTFRTVSRDAYQSTTRCTRMFSPSPATSLCARREERPQVTDARTSRISPCTRVDAVSSDRCGSVTATTSPSGILRIIQRRGLGWPACQQGACRFRRTAPEP